MSVCWIMEDADVALILAVLVQSVSIFLVPIFVGVLTVTPWIVTIKLAKVYNTSY